jgi:hypothetical protein
MITALIVIAASEADITKIIRVDRPASATKADIVMAPPNVRFWG